MHTRSLLAAGALLGQRSGAGFHTCEKISAGVDPAASNIGS